MKFLEEFEMEEKYLVKLKVWGEFACFTRPDLKVERMTYPCMTPSAARGILDSILWKPEFIWHIHRINVLKPIRFFSIKRNEINSKQGRNPIVIEDKRVQRNSIILKDVAYIIEASVVMNGYSENNTPKKYMEMFKRRVRKGQCYRRPYLGCREFSAEFSEPDDSDNPIPETIPIGSMLLDMFYDDQGQPSPRYFYDVKIEDGVLNCSEAYQEILSSTHFQPEHPEEIEKIIHELDGSEVEE